VSFEKFNLILCLNLYNYVRFCLKRSVAHQHVNQLVLVALFEWNMQHHFRYFWLECWNVNKSVFSHLRTLATRHCPHSPPYAAAVAIDRYLLPDGTSRRTDRRTDTVPFRRPCCAYYASSVSNQQSLLAETAIVASLQRWHGVNVDRYAPIFYRCCRSVMR